MLSTCGGCVIPGVERSVRCSQKLMRDYVACGTRPSSTLLGTFRRKAILDAAESASMKFLGRFNADWWALDADVHGKVATFEVIPLRHEVANNRVTQVFRCKYREIESSQSTNVKAESLFKKAQTPSFE